jgi:hypothetical protein
MKIDEDPVGESDKDLAAGSDPLPDWRIPYLDCLIRETLLTDKAKAQRLTCHAKFFIIIEGELY